VADEPMAPYLAFFAAGRYAVDKGRRAGLPWFVAVSEQLSAGEQRAAMTLMRRTPGIVGWLEKRLGDYPFSTTGGLTTALNPGFALENQTRPTYPAVGSGATSLVVHELAHQWFGNSVSVRGWRDIWLNEGPATFMELHHAETHGGQSAAGWLRRRYDQTGAASSFWDLRIARPGHDRLFANAVYTRGAMTLQALRNRVGDEDFWAILRTWLSTRADRNGSTEQFQALAESTSGEDLDAFFSAWLFTGEKPADTADNGLG
jgi:aminopeptidase N